MRQTSAVIVFFSAMICFVIGCGGTDSGYKPASEIKKAPADHAHAHDHSAKGPHGGSLVELGDEEFHAEVVLDADQHTLRVFVLGKDAKTPQGTVAQEVAVASHGKNPWMLKPVPQEGVGEGKTSLFEIVDESIVHEILDAKLLHADLKIQIDDKPYTGHIDMHIEQAHSEHTGHEKPAKTAIEADVPKTDGETK
ncbi:MAG: hypothetical protein NTW75_01315 [Planctomycetales bacterium]|jgi:hypothetical protein|nr:hypothetical protein [Planctomycetales bacterium]